MPIARSWLTLFLLAVLAMAARVSNIGSWDVWTDELHTVSIAESGQYSFGPSYKITPLHFEITGLALRVFGNSIDVARSVSAVIGILTVLLVYVLFRRILGERAAFIGALLLALSPWHTYWSQNARYFVLVTFFLVIGMFAFLTFWKEGRGWGIALAVVAMLGALLSHSSAALFLVAMICFVAASILWRMSHPNDVRSPSLRRQWIALGALTLLLTSYVPAYLVVGRYLVAINSAWNPAWNIAGSIAFYVPAIVLLAALAGYACLHTEGEDSATLFPVIFAVPLVLLLLASNFTTASAAYLLPSLPIIHLMAGVMCDRLLRHSATSSLASYRAPVVLLTAGIVLSEASGLALYHTFYRGLKPRWSDAIEYIERHRTPQDFVLASEADVAAYYLGDSTGVRWLDGYIANDSVLASRMHPERATWFAVYLHSGSILDLSDPVRRHIEDRTTMVAVFPLSYGPKDRTIAVFYQDPER